MVKKICCENCALLEKVNKKPIYAICHKQNIVFKLWQSDTREYVCKEFKSLSCIGGVENGQNKNK